MHILKTLTFFRLFAMTSGLRSLTATTLRSHSCGELRLANIGQKVAVTGWVQKSRDQNHFAFVDLRDRYGITQCVFFKDGNNDELTRYELAKKLGREWVIRVTGEVVERSNKNPNRPTGDVEVVASTLEILNESKTPPFLIQDDTDAKEDLRMQFRNLDIRRNPIKNALILRARVASLIRSILSTWEFVEIETPVLIKSTPEGARDFVVPSRMNQGCFYALPQSPQTFKQILMVAGMDKYFQIVKCFRDEELRADRQPEFTQVDCEMSFVSQEDVLATFEKLIVRVFSECAGVNLPPFERMTYDVAMTEYGIDKPDVRFDMKLVELTNLTKGRDFKVFEEAELVVAIRVPGDFVDEEAYNAAIRKQFPKKQPPQRKLDSIREKYRVKCFTKKSLKALESLARSDAVAAGGLVWVKVDSLKEAKFNSTVKKFYKPEDFAAWAEACGAGDGDLLLVLSGPTLATQTSMGRLRNIMGTRLGLRNEGFAALWVVDFPLVEWNEDEGRYTAMHHPFTSPKDDDFKLMEKDETTGEFDLKKIGQVRANAYDLVVNGVEVGGGSIRIHERDLQHKVFELLGFTKEQAEEQFGFLLGAFEHGAPPHGGLAFGLDRLCTIIGGAVGLEAHSIRDYIAFPKNNQGRDMMIDSPSPIAPEQMAELGIPPQWVRDLNAEQMEQLRELWFNRQAGEEGQSA